MFIKVLSSAFIMLLLTLQLYAQSVLQSNNIKKSIGDVIMKQQQDWNKGSIEKYMNGYNHTDSVRFASGGSISYGWKNMLDRYKKSYPDKSTMGRLEFSNIDITPLSTGAAMVFGKWKLTRQQDEPWGYFTLLFRKTKSGWKIVHDHTSSAAVK